MAAHTREVAAAVYPDPQRLYEKDEFHRKSPLGYWTGALSGFAFGCSSHLYNNLVYNRPYWAGIPRTLTYGVVGAFVFHHAKNYYDFVNGYRDQVHKHYVKLHPELFPAPPKIKVADTFEPWAPGNMRAN